MFSFSSVFGLIIPSDSDNLIYSPVPAMRSEEVMDDLCETFKDTSLEGRLLGNSSLNAEQEEFICSICNEPYCNTSPRVLSCLHVFCESCIDNKLRDASTEQQDGQRDVRCAICEQVTNVKTGGALTLPCDYVLINVFEIGAIKSSALLCTSCKAKEKAVARCVDCPHFLCPNCNTAHQYMRCFENHYVVSLEELKQSNDKIPFHKPIYCDIHKKLIKLYCHTCQEAICFECTNNEHKSPPHVFDNLNAVGLTERQKLEGLVHDAKLNLDECMKSNSDLENALNELQIQHDSAKDLINETFQSYKAVLEKCRDEALEQLGKVHTCQELKVMDAMQNMEKKIDKMEYACSFTTRLLENGSDGELLMLNRFISKQLEMLSENVNYAHNYRTSLNFITDMEEFSRTTKKSFGYVQNPDAMAANENALDVGAISRDQLLESSSECLVQSNALAINVMNGNGIGCASTSNTTVSMQSSPVTSSPLSMPSSFDGDLNFQGVAPQTPPLEGLTTLGEINLTRLASLAACNGKPPTPPITNSNNVPSAFPLDLLGASNDLPSNLINNIQALAKLGNVHLPEADIITNGYAGVNGMNATNVITAASYDSNVEATSVLDLVNGTALPVVNGHNSPFDNGNSHFFAAHSNGVDSSIMHNIGMNHHNGYGSNYSRSSSQRVAALEIHFKFGQLGSAPCQFGSPHGFCIGEDDAIIVADTNNHRIQIFNKDGEFRTQFGMAGKLEGQLWYPRKVELLPSGNYVICDRGNERSRLQLFSRDGMFIKKIRLKYVDIVAGMTVTEEGEIVIVDSVQPSLYKLDEHGTLSTWFDCKGVMTEPSDIAVKDQKFYICDFKGHCVVVFSPDGHFLNRIGNQGLTDYPNGIDVLPNGHILVGDSHGNKFHICIFLPDGTLLCEYECPYVKVSRCCGLKITSEGCIITVAKNNHHVLVLKSPF